MKKWQLIAYLAKGKPKPVTKIITQTSEWIDEHCSRYGPCYLKTTSGKTTYIDVVFEHLRDLRQAITDHENPIIYDSFKDNTLRIPHVGKMKLYEHCSLCRKNIPRK